MKPCVMPILDKEMLTHKKCVEEWVPMGFQGNFTF